MSSRNSSIDFNDNISASSLRKLILLSTRTLRYTYRSRYCNCIPIIICELIVPLLMIGIILYVSHYLMNNKKIDENNKKLSNNSLFDLNANEKCSQNPSKDFFNERNFFHLEEDCFNIPNEIYHQKYSKINLIIRFLNQQNDDYLFEKFVHRMKNDKELIHCMTSKRSNIILWDHLPEEDKNENSILFEENNSLNIIIDINQLSFQLFQYEIIVPMPQLNKLKEKLEMKIDHSFLQRHQHPAEQIDMFKMSSPPFTNIKMFIDSIGINLMLQEDLPMISWTHHSISCTSYRQHNTIPTRWSFILMELSLSIIYLFYYLIIVHLIIQENIQKVKEIIKIIHIQPLINYLAWALRTFSILSMITFSITVLWKISINGWIIFKYVSSSILLLAFTLLNLQLISYSILMGQLFNSFSRLFLLTMIIWIIMNILAFKEFEGIYQFILCLNPYFSLIYVLRHIFLYERSMNNVNLYQRLYRWSPILLNIFLIIFFSIPIYWILIWYFEKIYPGEYGIALKWNFPFTIEYWKSNETKSNIFNRKMSDESLKSLSNEDEDEEDHLNDNENNLIVQIKSLVKYFPETNRTVVNNVSFNLYENEITALLGHNGAGKTTIMNMLCGIYEQTSGEMKICNYNTRNQMESLRQLISYCPQHDILFDLLTVKEQIEFHAIARGYLKNKEEICSDLLQSVNLIKDENVLCQNLSGGMKRRLSIACAFIGNTKFVLLDEPSSGLDPINRRLLWQWIRSMRTNRTILLSTHFMEEADALSDRIIILSNGKVRANDCSNELKRIYGSGYKLVLNKNEHFDHINLFEIIEKYLIHSSIEIETDNQLIIQTNEQLPNIFLQLFKHLDFLKDKNIILNYGLSNTTLDEVFLRIAMDENDDEYENNEELIKEYCSEIFNERLIEEGYDFYLSQYEALFIKSFRQAYRNYIFILFICFIPLIISNYLNQTIENDQILFSFNDYSHLKEQNLFIAIYPNHYDQQIFQQIKYLVKQRSPETNCIFLNNITNIIQLNHLLSTRRQSDVNAYSYDYIGILFENNERISILTSHLIIGYEAFSLVSEYFCREKCLIKSGLKFVKNRKDKLNEKNLFSFLKSLSLCSCFYGIYPGELTEIYLLTYYLIYIYISILIINEKKELRNLMKIFGLHPILYWTSRYLFDFMITILYSTFLYFIYSLHDQQEYTYQNKLTFEQILNQNNLKIKKRFFPFTLIISATTLPFIYLLTKLMKNALIGGLSIFFILILIEFIDLIRIILLIMLKGSMKGKFIYWIINLIFPPLNSKRLISILLKNSSKRLCQLMENDKEILSKIGFVKEMKENDIWIHFILSLFQISFLFLYLCLIDINMDFFHLNQLNLNHYQFNENDLDEQVLKERLDLLSNQKSLFHDPFVCMDIVKKYPQKENLAINHLTFRIQQGQCFALLGFNGAGKTSLFKIIVGEEKATHGSIYINGKRYVHLTDGICQDIGYCPQYDCIEENLTLEDYLYLFGRLKGIVNYQLKQIIDQLCQLFLLDLFLNQYLKQLSGGTIRRMHAALACFGPPDLILLDEPTTGVDPYSRRQMRKVFEYALKNGITMLLTSHSMEECEILSTRIGIMSQGQLKCLGNIEDLKKEFGNGYIISMKLDSNNENVDHLSNYLKKEMNIEISHQTESTILFQTDCSSPSKLFYLIEQIKDLYHIQSYQIQQTNLEQIFLNLQYQNN